MELDYELESFGLPGPLSFIHRSRFGRAVGGFVTGGPTGAISGFFTGGGAPSKPAVGMPCVRKDGLPGGRMFSDGHCHLPEAPGPKHRAQQIIPGGETGLPVGTSDRFGEAVVGAFGMAALEPAIVGSIEDKMGNVNPIRRCPPGTVLGRDDLCYNKLPANWRKWPKAPRAPVTAADAKCIRKAAAATQRVARLAKAVGLTTHHAKRAKK